MQLPYILVGFIVWAFVSGCISEGAEVFIANEGLIKQLPAPLSVHVYRLMWRQMLFFAHNLIVYVVMLVVFPQSLGWASLLAIPAFLLLAVNGAWVALLLGIVTHPVPRPRPIIQQPRAAAVLPDADRLDLRGPAEEPGGRRARPAGRVQPASCTSSRSSGSRCSARSSTCGTGSWSSSSPSSAGP